MARTLGVVGLGARTGGSTLVHRARRLVTPRESRPALDDDHALKTASQVADALGNMRGAMMKLGQMASYVDEGLPSPLRTALAQLQQSAPPMAASLARSVVDAELGRSAFAWWEPQPIAAASIGQVHRARTADGRMVAVKVQYPGVDEAIRADLASAGTLFRGLAMLYPGLDHGPIVEELRARVLEELDYENEAANQQGFAAYYEGHPFIHIPAVVPSLCTRRVLTTELATGVRFSEVVSDWSLEERNLAAEAIYRFVFRSMWQYHAFNGDPHPGNYLFNPGGQVTFLDFGLVKKFVPEETALWGDMLRAMVVDRDAGAFRRAVERAGLLPAWLPFTDEEIADYFRPFYAIVESSETVTITSEYASSLVRRTFDRSGAHGEIMRRANVPPAFVIIQRINMGLFAVLAALGATANWRLIGDELWPWSLGPPSTPMGEQEAAWLATR